MLVEENKIMAVLLTFAGVDPADRDESNVFYPKSSFAVQAVGTITNNAFKVQQLPEQETGGWIDSPTIGSIDEIDDTDNILVLNAYKGFKYKVVRTGSGESVPSVYWGVAATVQQNVSQ